MRVVIADDAALLRHGLARLLEEAGVEVCGVAEEAGSLLTLVEASHPDVANPLGKARYASPSRLP